MFVAITKTVGELETVPPEHKSKHPNYPIECQEVFGKSGETITKEMAASLFPGRPVMTFEEYSGYKSAMNDLHLPDAVPKKWFQFWKKNNKGVSK